MSTRFTNYLRKKRENPEYRKREKLAEVAADLRILLADAGLSQRELAARLAMSDQALSKKLSGANLTLGALFDYCEALGKEFDIAYRDKGARHASRDVPATLEGAYVFDQRERVAARPPRCAARLERSGQRRLEPPASGVASMNEELIQQAIQCLSIQNVALRQARLDLADEFDPALAPRDLLVQFRAAAKRVHQVEFQIENGPPQRHFQVEFECGLRLADAALIRDDDPATGQVAEIQALFLADYLIKPDSTPDRSSLDAFASVNVGYHVWPYWREYLQSTCARAGLPLIALPMYTVPKANQAAKKTPRRKIAKV